jgi:hypothetical protein
MKPIRENITTITITDDETGETVEKTIQELLDDVFGPEDDVDGEFDISDTDDFDQIEGTEEIADIDDSEFDFLNPEEGDDVDMDAFSDIFDSPLEPSDVPSADVEPSNDDFDFSEEEFSDEEFPEDADEDLLEPSEFEDTESELSDMEGSEEEVDANFQGEIRTVTGANLVYKRQDDGGTYEELWIYNVGDDVKAEVQIRRAILAGTDILPSSRESEDGTQQADTYTVGNVQFLKLTGLPN